MLHNVHELEGYAVGASDGERGKVEDLYFDDGRWVIRYMVVETGSWLSQRKVLISRKWLRGKHVLLSPERIDHVSWSEHEVYVKVTREAVESSPEYDPSRSLSRDDEAAVYAYHGLEELS